MHRNYQNTSDIIVKIFDDHIIFTNPGRPYGNLTVEDLQRDDYVSVLRNRLLAEAFYLTGDIEKYGTGFVRVREWLRTYPEVSYTLEEIGDFFKVDIVHLGEATEREPRKPTPHVPDQSDLSGPAEDFASRPDCSGLEGTGHEGEAQEAHEQAQEAHEQAQEAQDRDQVGLASVDNHILSACRENPKAGKELAAVLGHASRTGSLKRSLAKLMGMGLIEMTIPEKPRSSKQKYRLTEKGRNLLTCLPQRG